MGGQKLYEKGLLPKWFVECLDEGVILTTGNYMLQVKGIQGHQL